MIIMSGLDALRCYGDDSSEDDEDTDEKVKGAEHQVLDSQGARGTSKKTPLPSVPLEVLGMFKNKEDPSTHSNPDLHDGRMRSFEHVRGNWATFAYITVEPTEVLQLLMDELISVLPPSIIDLKPIDDLHISISRTVALQLHWIEPFVQSLKEALCVSSFYYNFEDLSLYSNDEKTRSFVGLKVGVHGSSQFRSLVQCVDKCLQEFSLPVYYQNPCFHMSFAWCLGDYQQYLDATSIQRLKNCFHKRIQESPLIAKAAEVQCKIGNRMFSFNLR